MRISDWSSDVCSSDLPPTLFDQREPDARRQMRFSSAGRAEQDQFCAIFEPAVSGTDRHHLRLRYHRNRVEVERIERFSRQQFRLRQMPLDRKSTRLNSSHYCLAGLPLSALNTIDLN